MERISLRDALTQRVTLVRTEAERLQDYLVTLAVAIADGRMHMGGNRESLIAFAPWVRGI